MRAIGWCGTTCGCRVRVREELEPLGFGGGKTIVDDYLRECQYGAGPFDAGQGRRPGALMIVGVAGRAPGGPAPRSNRRRRAVQTPDMQFDVVIFDEASQVRPSDAVNALYRGSATWAPVAVFTIAEMIRNPRPPDDSSTEVRDRLLLGLLEVRVGA